MVERNSELAGTAIDWDLFITALMNGLCARFEKETLPVGHVKAILEHELHVIVVNFTGGKDTVTVRGAAGVGDRCKLTINARVETTPENLDAIVRDTLNAHTTAFTCTEIAWKFLQPGYPTPTYRFENIVDAAFAL